MANTETKGSRGFILERFLKLHKEFDTSFLLRTNVFDVKDLKKVLKFEDFNSKRCDEFENYSLNQFVFKSRYTFVCDKISRGNLMFASPWFIWTHLRTFPQYHCTNSNEVFCKVLRNVLVCVNALFVKIDGRVVCIKSIIM